MAYYSSVITRGGFFTGKISQLKDKGDEGGRFDPKDALGHMYRARYLNVRSDIHTYRSIGE
jgi:hypothetical protein